MNENIVNIVLPVYNEEKRISKGLDDLLAYLHSIYFDSFIITIADNASSDRTGIIAKNYCEQYEKVHYFKLQEKGLGIAFKEACKNNSCHIIGYMDIDMSTDLNAFDKMIEIFNSDSTVEIVNASRYNKNSILIGRTKLRDFISYLFVWILKLFFNMKATDAICGFKFFKSDIVNELLSDSGRERGWFLIIEMLLRAEREGRKIVEIPVKWTYDENSKVDIKKTTLNYLVNIFKLKGRFIIENGKRKR